jgi:hypothetical protein
MRYIDDHEVTLRVGTADGGVTERPFRMRDFVRFIIGSSSHFVRDWSAIQAAERVEEKCGKGGARGALELEPGDWERLKEAVESPSAGYPLQPAHRCAEFVRKVRDAKTRVTGKR